MYNRILMFGTIEFLQAGLFEDNFFLPWQLEKIKNSLKPASIPLDGLKNWEVA